MYGTYRINFEICTVCKHLSVPVVFCVCSRDCRYENQSKFTNPCRSAHNVVGGLAELNSHVMLASSNLDFNNAFDKVESLFEVGRGICECSLRSPAAFTRRNHNKSFTGPTSNNDACIAYKLIFTIVCFIVNQDRKYFSFASVVGIILQNNFIDQSNYIKPIFKIS